MSKKNLPDIWRIEIEVPAHAVALYESVLERFADAVSWFMTDTSGQSDGEGDWHLEGFSRTAPDRPGLAAALAVASAAIGVEPPATEISRVPNMDWVTENLRNFPPIDAGRYFVRGSHFEGRVPHGRVELLVDAGTAFGSGEHATTYGCLLALSDLARRRRFVRPLDLGCGSGILAIAVAKTWPTAVLAADIDPDSVLVAKVNMQRNGVAARVAAVVSDGYLNPAISRSRPYDLITANILARPLSHMAADLAAHLAPNGIAILSGLLNRQERQVLAAHRMQGLSLLRRYVINGWTTLVLSR